MLLRIRFGLLLLALLSLTAVASAQQSGPVSQGPGGKIYLDVVVTPKNDQPVTGLQQQDFTLLDNKLPVPIDSFRALGSKQVSSNNQPSISVILVIDAVNTDYEKIGFERQQIDKFLRVNGGHLAQPTALAVVTDTGTQIQQDFTTDGSALSTALDQYSVGLRSIRRSAGFYGASERLDLSLKALSELAAREASRPGRKIFAWISPGWPLLSGPEVQLGAKQEEQIFREIVGISTQLLQARITLYSVDPLGTADEGFRTFYYQSFVKPVTEANKAQFGNLGLQVLATQAGGLVLNSNNDTAALLQKSMTDTEAYYEFSFNPPVADQPDEYHRLEVRVDKPGLTARTRQGYYAQPAARHWTQSARTPIHRFTHATRFLSRAHTARARRTCRHPTFGMELPVDATVG